MKPTVPSQCHENWDHMKIGLISRHCESCQRDVIDFTKMRREEILHYLWTNRSEKVCGRFNTSQLDFHHDEILITVESFLKKNKNSNLAFYLLAASALLLLGCSEEKKSVLDTMKFPLMPGTLQMTSVDTVEVTPPEPRVDPNALSLYQFNLDSRYSINLDSIYTDDHSTELGLMGFTYLSAPFDNPLYAGSDISRLAPVMPSFVGGYDSLITFMNAHLQYPEWEKQNRVQGVVVAAFVIDVEGNVTQPKIVKSIPDAKNIDAEVLRVVNLMPRWNPGSDMGKNVPVEFTLPVRFKI